ncbi:uncharacterized protein LOC125582924 [Brassica napus]|uniref:uncharacterized protein LOC125582924 n=1 Tax=Brassica napus TaxID=3708 RepID=UPI002078ACF1|nr:uncharacterized protein LOC125582924 [Brassica napus]
MHYNSEVDDKYVWYPEPERGTGVFSANETWRVLHPYPVEVFWHKAVWFSGRIPKHVFIIWVAARDRMVTRDKLLRWGLTVPSNCVLCAGNQENRQHLFFDCAYSNQAVVYLVWKERNKRIHSAVEKPPCTLIGEIQQTVRLRLDHLARKQIIPPGQNSLLAAWFLFFDF